MSEEELINSGFNMVTISNEESQNGYDYYYYEQQLCEEVNLYTTDSVDVVDNNWEIRCWDIPAVRISTKEHYLQFVEVLNNIICE